MRGVQRGIGMIGILLVLGLAAFVVTVVLKLGPMYMNFWTLQTIMNKVASSPEAPEEGRQGIANLLSRNMDVNNVGHVGPKDFKIEKVDEGRYDLKLAYEQREHLFMNIDVVLKFEHEVAVPAK